MRSSDPVRDFLRHEADREEELEGLPECELCGEPIQDETCFCVDGNKYHKNCLDILHCRTHKRSTESCKQFAIKICNLKRSHSKMRII